MTQKEIFSKLFEKALEDNVTLDEFKDYIKPILRAYTDKFGLLDEDRQEFHKYFKVIKSPKDKDVIYWLSVLINKLNES